MNPRVSIIMSSYNDDERLEKTIESVLNQIFEDFEFIIINDGSTDSSQNILKECSLKDKRIVLMNNEENIGLTKSLNKGIEIAKGDYIARIDAGDLWDKTKLEKQIRFLDENKDYVICGAQAFYIDKNENILGQSWFAIDDKDIRQRFFTKEGTYLHPSIVFRVSPLRAEGIYYRDFFKYSQDLDLYCRLFFKGKMHCLIEPLISCKIDSLKISIAKKYYQRQYQKIAYRLFKQRIKHGKDDLDLGKSIKIKDSKIGLKLCHLSMPFYIKYMEARLSKKNLVLWLFWLVLSLIIYPPLIADYWERLIGIILYKKFKLKHAQWKR
jgi:glycosyltransferase involved in cell wall biosynthesis